MGNHATHGSRIEGVDMREQIAQHICDMSDAPDSPELDLFSEFLAQALLDLAPKHTECNLCQLGRREAEMYLQGRCLDFILVRAHISPERFREVISNFRVVYGL